VAPILFGLATDRWRVRVLDLDPTIDPAGVVWGAESLRHDALTAERAGMPSRPPGPDLALRLPSSADLRDGEAAPVALSVELFVPFNFKFASDGLFAAPPAGVPLSISIVWLFSLSDLGAQRAVQLVHQLCGLLPGPRSDGQRVDISDWA
jgi:hypothetical protein